MKRFEVVTFNPEFLSTYVELNREWIQKYFAIEPMDVAQLEDPYTNILNLGGEIFFVLEDGRPIGTCAMVAHGPGCYELAKMAVEPGQRGRGIGELLMSSAISWAREKGAGKIELLSNTILEPAISLYKKSGFQTTHLGEHPDYKRCNIVMELKLGDRK